MTLISYLCTLNLNSIEENLDYYLQLFSMFFYYKPNIEQTDLLGRTALHHAVKYSNQEALQQIYYYCQDYFNLDSEDEEDQNRF